MDVCADMVCLGVIVFASAYTKNPATTPGNVSNKTAPQPNAFQMITVVRPVSIMAIPVDSENGRLNTLKHNTGVNVLAIADQAKMTS